MSGGAVQRRRGGGAASAGQGSSSGPNSHHARQSVGSRSGDGDEYEHKVAYDPVEEAQSTTNQGAPVLTLMEEVVLIGLKDSQGYLSFWNDSISYVLRGCILIELALQGKIAMIYEPGLRNQPLNDGKIEVLDDGLTGEVLLDETLKLMKSSEPMSVANWIDCLSGETWNFSKISYQLKQVRERLSKGLVDKGICRTEKKNFFLFDMATHPVVDPSAKQDIRTRVLELLNASTYSPSFPNTKYFPARLPMKVLRTLALAASAYAANVLENLYSSASYDARDNAFLKVDEILTDYSQYPFHTRGKTPWDTSVHRAVVAEIPDMQAMQRQLEVVAAVFTVYTQLDAVV